MNHQRTRTAIIGNQGWRIDRYEPIDLTQNDEVCYLAFKNDKLLIKIEKPTIGAMWQAYTLEDKHVVSDFSRQAVFDEIAKLL